jgi:hypothetical protein
MTDADLTNDELKKVLRKTAEERNIDLSDPENRFTLWTRHGWWGHLFWGGASYPARAPQPAGLLHVRRSRNFGGE